VWAHHLVPTGQWIDPPLPLPESFDVCFAIPEKMECADQKVTGCYAMSGRTVLLDDTVFSVSDTYDHWVMFNGDGKQDFLCVEPQSGQVNGLNIPGGCRELAAGEEDVFRFTLSKK
jgi:galactose mutarotase-like enzyme